MKLLFIFDLSATMKGDLDSGTIPPVLTAAFSAHGVPLPNPVLTSIDGGWQIDDSGKSYPLSEGVTLDRR